MAFKSFMKTQAYKEIREGWWWMEDTDPEGAAAAKQWAKDHPEEWKEAEHMLYYSEANYRKRFSLETLEDADSRHSNSYNPEAFLPEEVRNSIYQDKCWFDMSKYLPEGSDVDPDLYLSTEIVDGLHELTELQREILFRNIINRESTESIARDKQCTSRNIRDIRSRALKHLRSKLTRHEGSGDPKVVVLALLAVLAIYFGLEILTPIYPWLVYVVIAIMVLACVLTYLRFRDNEVEGLLRNHWASLHGVRKKK